MWLFDFFKKKFQAKKSPTLQDSRMQNPTRPAPPMPRVRPARKDDICVTTIHDNTPVFIPQWVPIESVKHSEDRLSLEIPLTGGGGTFDGGGASGDWSDSRSCGSPSDNYSSSSSDYGSSDSSSSCDSGSSYSSD